MDDIYSKEFNDEVLGMMNKIFEDTERELKPGSIENKIQFNNLLLDYLRRMGTTIEGYSDVIPSSFDLLNTSTKIKILSECLENGKMIEQSKIYNSSLEGHYEPNYYQDASKYK